MAAGRRLRRIFKPTGILGVKEFSMSGLIARVFPGFKNFMDDMER